ncbi:MAG: type IV secretory system conjugative DNA transfer family protein, partial [Desulfovibrionaceae bacterium]|nr:type IV secretory system conjugative DNA transfer family protein [Desulfovibrionaceae bacterium]
MDQLGFVKHTPRKECVVPRADQFMRFDSGRGISFAEGCHNTIILGSTGSGKTSSAILPAAAAFLSAGFPGLAIDIKGCFS